MRAEDAGIERHCEIRVIWGWKLFVVQETEVFHNEPAAPFEMDQVKFLVCFAHFAGWQQRGDASLPSKESAGWSTHSWLGCSCCKFLVSECQPRY